MTERRALLAAAFFLLAAAAAQAAPGAGEERPWAELRARMVREQLSGRDVRDPRVLAAMGKVPRHLFVPAAQRAEAYSDQPLPIGAGQTISQPYVVALMSELLELRGGERVLEVGTGSGYQAAILAELGAEVYSIEIDPNLAAEARARLEQLGYRRVHIRAGDGFFGWPEAAPFDAIIVTAAAPRIPEALLAQLREGGRIVAPLGRDGEQDLVAGVKREGRLRTRKVTEVLFVPMTGAIRARHPPHPPAGATAEPAPQPTPEQR